jgi:enoyl-CoA hydratase/carnithine racemase
MAERIVAGRRGDVVDLTFDHAPINVYDLAMRDELAEVLAGVIADPSARVLVFRARGAHFSAGADLREFGTAPSLWAMRDARWQRDVWGLLRAVEIPMVASMQGNTVGFGFELALHCDFRVAADSCVVALPESRIGMIPAGGATQTLVRIAGTSGAAHAILTGERIPAATAHGRWLVDVVVPSAELQARTDALADVLAALAPAAVRAVKRLVWSAPDHPLAFGLALEADLGRALPA